MWTLISQAIHLRFYSRSLILPRNFFYTFSSLEAIAYVDYLSLVVVSHRPDNLINDNYGENKTI
jgi:hypothetical protein